ncbi:MAG: signal peptide peptidase SppA [Elusimicrobiales bacterium]
MEEEAKKNDISRQSLSETKIVGKKKKISLLSIAVYTLCILYLITVVVSVKIVLKKPQVSIGSKITKTIIRSVKGEIVVVPIYGVIYKRLTTFSNRGSDYVVSVLKKYAEDKDVKAFVLDINSPGGSVGAVQEIYSMLLKIKGKYKKPVIAHLGDVAASGGYYIACAADKIYSNSGSLTGSIGVMFSTMEGEELFKKIGIRSNTIKSGRFKDIGSFSRQMTKEEKRLLEDIINDTYSVFVDVVSKGRKMSYDKAKELSDGRIFTGNQALSNGLVDAIGDLDDAIREAAMLCGLGEDFSVIRARGDLIDEIFIGIDSMFGFLKLFSFSKDMPLIEYRFAI